MVFFPVVQKYSNQGVLCQNIQIRVFRAEILIRYRYALPSRADYLDRTKCNVYSFSGSIDQKKWDKINALYNQRQVCYFTVQKKCFILDSCRNIAFSCRNITMWPAFTPTFLCRAIFRGCAEIFIFRRHIHLCPMHVCMMRV